jgi:hypothetical protein
MLIMECNMTFFVVISGSLIRSIFRHPHLVGRLKGSIAEVALLARFLWWIAITKLHPVLSRIDVWSFGPLQ